MTKIIHFISAFTLLLLCIGCGGNYPLSGKVTFSDDDSPVKSGAVIFTTETHVAQGKIEEDGSFVVGFEKLNDGIPPGNYKVYIAGSELFTLSYAPNGGRIEKYVQQIDPKYTSAETSGLTFKSDGSQRVFNIQVERPPGARSGKK